MKKRASRLCLFVFALLSAGGTYAEIVRIDWSGDMNRPGLYTVQSPYDEFLRLPNTVYGSMIYDTSVAAHSTGSNTAEYLQTSPVSITTGLEVFGTLETLEGSGGTISVSNNLSNRFFGSIDTLDIETNGISSPDWGPGEELVIGLELSFSRGALADTSLPSAAALATALDDSLITFGYVILPDGERINMEFAPDITVTTVNPVPLPAAGWLLGSALLGLGWAGRKSAPRSRHNKPA